MSKILRVFMNVDLRNAHEGLSELAKKNKVDVNTLENGEYLIFINAERNKLKLYASNQVLAYLKLPRGKIDLRVISKIPQAFKASGKIQYEEHLKEMIENKLKH